MALSRNFNISDTNEKFAKDIWDIFVSLYNYVGVCGLFISYPHNEFKAQGIPTPWQAIAWRRLIRIMGEGNFCRLPIVLNYLGSPDVLFKRKFIEDFSGCSHPEELEVTFNCGYFWRFNENRRDKMLDFVVEYMLNKGTKVTIRTQDDTLENAFNEKLIGSDKGDNLCINCVDERIDVHYTLIKDNEVPENSLLFMELPHTEAHDFRLETYLTFETLGSFKYNDTEEFINPEKFIQILNSYIPSHRPSYLVKRLFSQLNRAINTERKKHEGKSSSC